MNNQLTNLDEAIEYCQKRYDETSEQQYQFLQKQLRLLQKLQEKKKKPKSTIAETALFVQFLRTYREWMTNKFGVIPDYNGAKAKALKDIVTYFSSLANSEDAKAHEAFEHLLADWDKLNPFLRGQTDLTSINRNKQEIVTKLKNGATSSSTNNREQSASSFMESVLS